MGRPILPPPAFPKFKWSATCWVTSAILPAWVGVFKDGISDGTVEIAFMRDYWEDKGPLSREEIGLVQWLIDHQASVHDAMLKQLFEAYPEMRQQAVDWYGEEDEEMFPNVRSPEELKKFVSIPSVFVHQVEQEGKPFIGVAFHCTWEVEHGVGLLLHGDQPLEVGQADTAMGVPEQYRNLQS